MTQSRRVLAAAMSACSFMLASVGRAQPVETMKVPIFGSVTIYQGSPAPREVVLFISGDGGWNLGVVDMAERLRDAGALVVGIDIRTYIKSLEASGSCAYPAGSLEELSRAVQLRYKLPTYVRPILVGYSSGATLVYAALAAAPPETFAGAISLAFCPGLTLQKPLCQMRGLAASRKSNGRGYDVSPFPGSTVPWMVLQGEVDRVCGPDATRSFVTGTGAASLFSLPRVGHGFSVPANWEPQFLEAYRAITESRYEREEKRVTSPGVVDLSLVEVPSTGGPDRNTMAVFLSGDGGWADIDKSIAAGLAAAGIPVVGWSSLEYYWTPRTPQSAAADLARIVEHYTATWRKARVLVVGYSFGANVAPFLVNRLPAPLEDRVTGVALLGPSRNAALEFRLASWLGGGADPANPIAPEIVRLPVPVLRIGGRRAGYGVPGRQDVARSSSHDRTGPPFQRRVRSYCRRHPPLRTCQATPVCRERRGQCTGAQTWHQPPSTARCFLTHAS